ncbi:hypothetical protein [Pontibacter vulgaris]|uniref:hypothetical protein n=1 Tax=Pontibacter vulgaris TaxID=2905679 RepID=UPI001FA7EBFE|nr:hypothetical protein [Pontibacter vulgaris]
MLAHAYRDPATGKYWNSATQKFVVRLRESRKGKAKGVVYTEKVKALDIPAANAWLPNGLSKEDLTIIFDTFWNYKIEWEMDMVIATINCLYFNRYCRGFKNDFMQDDGYLYVPNKQFQKWVHDKKYVMYLNVLIEAQVIQRTIFDFNPHDVRKPLYAYRINPNLIDRSSKQWYKIGYESDRMNIKVHQRKQERIKNLGVSEVRNILATWCEELVREIDIDALTSDLEGKVKRSRKADPWNMLKVKKTSYSDFLEITRRLVNGDLFYCNLMDIFGFRFHSPFTNIHSFIYNYVRIDGQPVAQNDIKNSQMYFLSLCFSDMDAAYSLLKESDENGKFWSALMYMQQQKDAADLKLFCTLSRSGAVYDALAQRLSIKRKGAKNKLMKVLFSNRSQCFYARSKVKEVYPTLVVLADALNDEMLIPQMLQRMEAKMLDLICAELIALDVKIITCHDSITSSVANCTIVNQTIKKVFQQLNLPQPMVAVKEFSGLKGAW